MLNLMPAGEPILAQVNPPASSLEIVGGRDADVAEWVLAQIPDPMDLPGGFAAIGVARDGRLIGGCLYTNYRVYPNGGTIDISCAGHGWLSRRIVGVMLGYPFSQLGCHRLTALTRKRNKAARRLLEALGFRMEGVHSEHFGPRSGDCLSYGLLKQNNRWRLEGQ